MTAECELRRLADVADIYSGSNLKPSKEVTLSPAGCPWVRVEDLDGGRIGETSRTLTEEEMKGVRLAPPEAVLLSSVGTIGKVGIADRYVAPSNNIIVLEFRPYLVLPLYGMYCLRALRAQLEAESKGAVYSSLRLSKLRELMIPVPGLELQRQIAGKLDLLRQGILAQEKARSSAQQAVQSAFDTAFREEIRAAAAGEKGHLRLERCADIRLNGALKKPEPGNPEVPYVSTAQLHDWEVDWSGAPAAQVEQAVLGRYSLQDGDIVMNRINQADRLGRCGLIRVPPERAVFAQNTMRIRADPGQVHPYFLMAWLTHPAVKSYVQEHAKRSTSFQSSLSRGVMDALPVPRVELSRQHRFAGEYGDYLEYVKNADRILDRLRRLEELWYRRIRLLRQEGRSLEEQEGQLRLEEQEVIQHQKKRFWITPAGTECFYDSYLECIQAPGQEAGEITAKQLPIEEEVQFLEGLRNCTDPAYGQLEHLRLHRTSSNTWQLVRMQPEAYRPDGQDLTGDMAKRLEEAGLISEAQDFGYLRETLPLETGGSTPVEQLLKEYAPPRQAHYSRFGYLPGAVRQFVAELSPFQQGVYEEFLLAMQPLTCHMVHKQMLLRTGQRALPDRSLQDVVATVELLEGMGLLERRQGLVLEYDGAYQPEEERRPILDHRGRPIPMDTWIWAAPKE